MVVSRGWHWSNARRADQSRNPAARRDRGERRTQDRTDGEHPGAGKPKLERAESGRAAFEEAAAVSGRENVTFLNPGRLPERSTASTVLSDLDPAAALSGQGRSGSRPRRYGLRPGSDRGRDRGSQPETSGAFTGSKMSY